MRNDEYLADLLKINYHFGHIRNIEKLDQGTHKHYLIRVDEDIQYILREYQTNHYLQTKDHHKLELELLYYLKKNGVRVAAPIKTKTGHLLFTQSDETFALFEFAKGCSTSSPTITQTDTFGKELAKLHLTATKFSKKTKRNFVDRGYDFLINDPAIIISEVQQGKYSSSIKLLQYFQEVLKRSHQNLSNKSLSYGVIHADTHFHNNFFDEEDAITFFDFDFIGLGWYVYDIATGLWSLASFRDVENFSKLKESLLDGYQSIHSLSEDDLQNLHLIMELRNLETFVFQIKMSRQRNVQLTDKFFEQWTHGTFNVLLKAIDGDQETLTHLEK